jgi:hypothetical protein
MSGLEDPSLAAGGRLLGGLAAPTGRALAGMVAFRPSNTAKQAPVGGARDLVLWR